MEKYFNYSHYNSKNIIIYFFNLGANIIKNGRITPKPFWNTIKIKKTKKSNHVQPILNTEIIKLPPI